MRRSSRACLKHDPLQVVVRDKSAMSERGDQDNLNTQHHQLIVHGGPLTPFDVHQLVLDTGLPQGPRSPLRQARAGVLPPPFLVYLLFTCPRGLPRTTKLSHSSGYASSSLHVTPSSPMHRHVQSQRTSSPRPCSTRPQLALRVCCLLLRRN